MLLGCIFLRLELVGVLAELLSNLLYSRCSMRMPPCASTCLPR